MKIIKKGSAIWSGGIKDGTGNISTESGVLNASPYGFKTRFEGTKGTNPEELMAAAHASCFTMALSLALGEAKFTAEKLETEARFSLEENDGGYAITESNLFLKAKVPGITQKQFEEIANKAKENCPVSKLLNAKITLQAILEVSHKQKAS